MKTRLAKVAPDDHHILAGCCHRVSEIAAERGLAVSGVATRHEQRLDWIVNSHELDRRSDIAEGLCSRSLRLFGGDQERDTTIGPFVDRRDQTEYGDPRRYLLEVRSRSNLVVDGLLKQR